MAGKQKPAEQALQATQPADSPPGSGLTKHNNQQLAGLAAKTTTTADDVLPLAVQVGGGSAKVLALRKAGADLPNLSLPHLTPLPVTVPTHSLNL